MTDKKINDRVCCACRQKFDKNELIKITLIHDTKELKLNPDSKTFGRSAYICRKKECVEKAFKKNNIFNRLKIKPTETAKLEMEKIKEEIFNLLSL